MDTEGYLEDNFLQLSGIQHFIFCRRQWALIHVEQQWCENALTTDGQIFHERVHDEHATELRNGILTVRGMRVFSKKIGISGTCDAVEFRQSSGGIRLFQREGRWNVYPIEYKRGRYDFNEADAAQLCAEAMCLEEMLCCHIPKGYLFWGETHRRKEIVLDSDLRTKVTSAFSEMHEYYQRGYTPKVKQKKGCSRCSLKDICLPEITKVRSVKTYIRESLRDDK